MRVKRGYASRRRHKAILKKAKGFRGRRKSCFKLAKIAVERSLQNQYTGRKLRKRDFRKLWIARINAAVRPLGLSYSRFIAALKKAEIAINRKLLSELAISEPETFKAIVSQATA